MRKKAKALFSAVLVIAMATAFTITGGIHSASAATTHYVSTYSELSTAISSATSGDAIEVTSDIVVTAELPISKTLTINGNGHTISVPVPGLDDSGTLNSSASPFRVFNLTSGTLTINDATIKGGAASSYGSGIYVATGATLHLSAVTVSNSGGTGQAGGGIANYGTCYLYNCNIIRNGASYGGGFLNVGSSAKMFVENCSFSENRSLSSSGGGGAGENKSSAYLYINNSTFSNNKSTELGGAINNYNGIAYILNSTFTGNVNFYSTGTGGAIRISGSVYLFNDIFAYNFSSNNGGSSYIQSDFYGSPASACYCIFHGTTVSGTGNVQYSGAADGSDDTLFTGGSTSKILAANGSEMGTATVYQPYLAKVEAGITTSVPLQPGSTVLYTGTKTGFTNGSGSPVVGYYNQSTSAWVTLVGSDAASYEVTTDQNGSARASTPTKGAVETTTAQLYMIKVNSATGGTVNGGTVYGDTYAAGAPVTLTAIPASGYKFSSWRNAADSSTLSTDNPYTFTVTQSLTITPVFEALGSGEYIITYVGNGNTGGTVPDSGTYTEPATISDNTGGLTKTGYTFNGWNTRANGSGTGYAAGDAYSLGVNLTLYAQWAVEVAPGELAGSIVEASFSNVNLTSLGDADWAIWGYSSSGTSTSLSPDESKSGGNGISDLTDIDPGTHDALRGLGQYHINHTFSWTDGTGTASATGVNAGIQHNILATHETGDGFSFTVPADKTKRRLIVYTAVHFAVGELTATLSDGSTVDLTLEHDAKTGINVPSCFIIDYAAGSSGQTLTVTFVTTWNNTDGNGNVQIYAAALSSYHTATIDIYKDGSAMDASGSVELRQSGSTVATAASTGETGVYSALVLNGTYDIYIDGTDTETNITISGADGSASINYYTVAFDSQGGSAVDSVTAIGGSTISAPTDPAKSAWDFGGWYKESGCTNAWSFPTDTVTGILTLYAKWTATPVTFNDATLPEGTCSVAYSTTVAASDGSGSFTYELASGSLPAGLSLSADGEISGTPTVPGSSSFSIKATDTVNGATATADFTLEIVSLGTVAAPAASPVSGDIDAGDAVTLSTTTPEAAIYYTTNGDTPTSASTLYTGAITLHADTTIKAVAIKAGWTDSSVSTFSYTIITYTVSYDGNGAAEGSAPVDAASYTKGGTAAALSNTGSLAKTGYTFNGWNTETDESGTHYGQGATITVQGDTTLYAEWQINTYAVTFKDWNGTVLKTQQVNYEGAATAPSDPKRTGYTFTGWSVSYDRITADTTVTAKYKINYYTVTFKDWDGTILKSSSVKYGNDATPPSDPNRTGYTFTGWSPSYEDISYDTVITAKYKINDYTVAFHTNGGSEVDSQTVTYNETANKPDDPTKEGYMFDAWYADSALTAAYDFESAVTDDITLYAGWIGNSQAVQQAAQALTMETAFRFADGDTWECVTSDFIMLGSGSFDTTLTWTSSDTDIVRIEPGAESTAGIVTRPENEDTSIIITATISKGDISVSKTFLLIIKKEGRNQG